MKKVIVLLGAPGSGKGTQAKLLANNFGLVHISTGDLLRSFSSNEKIDQKDKEMLEQMKSGKLVPDELVYRLAFEKIEQVLARDKGVVLDGAIRTLEQAKKFQSFFRAKGLADEIVVIDAHISDEVSLNRLLYRAGTVKEARADDQLEIMEHRIKAQGNASIKPILDYYKNLGFLEKVDGEQSIEAVYRDILGILLK